MLEPGFSMAADVSTTPLIIHNGIHTQVPVSEDNRNGHVKPKVRQDGHYDKEGKRWARRRDNSRFAGNIHIVKPSTKDFNLSVCLPRSTFPKPLPAFLPRHLAAPSASLPHRDPISANAGRYSLSLKGVRKELRRSGPRAEQIVLDIEQELTAWLEMGGVLLSPDSQHVLSFSRMPGTPIGSSKSIIEIHRSPTESIWRIDEDFPRFLLHCVARFHGVVSFSKTTQRDEPEMRLTHLLRPNVTRPDFTAPGVLDTPPATDVDGLSASDTEESDVASDFALGSEAEYLSTLPLVSSSFSHEEGRGSQVRSSELPSFDEAESSLGEREDDTLSISVESLTFDTERRDWEPTARTHGVRASPVLSRSPSRSVRQSTRRVPGIRVLNENRLRFWQYVFA
ncbi:hypothetical protein JB92DRAFT_3036945 [Gautieria morchelliformis]|nr:hypothetical protein JB92DRAFT_3036945 [Gautieria morchelliformis]